MTSSYPELEATSTFTETTPTEPREPTKPTETTESTKEGGQTGAREKPNQKGFNVAAVVVPLVLLLLLALLLVAAFFYYKRRKAKEKDTEPKEIIVMSSCGESPVSLENPCFNSSLGESPLSVENPCYGSEEAFDVYAEIKAPEKNGMDPKLDQESDNPLYESTA